MSQPSDYFFSEPDARDLMGLASLSTDARSEFIAKILAGRNRGQLLALLSQFIGLANSVVANNRDAIELILITEGGLHPQQAKKANLPTIFGALQGILLAKGVDQAKTCGGCAFRLGSHANQSPSTTCDADWCTRINEQDFMCHEHLDDKGEPTRKCTGFTQARRRRGR